MQHRGQQGAQSDEANEADATRREVLEYEIRVSEDGTDTYGAFKIGKHDDLVTALGLATQAAPVYFY